MDMDGPCEECWMWYPVRAVCSCAEDRNTEGASPMERVCEDGAMGSVPAAGASCHCIGKVEEDGTPFRV